MAKLPILFAFLLLAGSSHIISVTITPGRTTINVPAELVEQHENSPLSQSEWVWRQALRSIPAFELGTTIDDVRAELIDRNLRILREWPGYLVAREGVPLIDLSGPVRQSYLYGFENDRLVLGPQTIDEVILTFWQRGMTPEDVSVLHQFLEVDTDNSDSYNVLAWLLATHPDESIIDPPAAIRMANYALSLEEVPDWEYVETLAAAYAADGQFKKAADTQARALALNAAENPGGRLRLATYQSGQRHISSIEEISDDGVDDEPPTPRADLIRTAASGDADAQWTLAVFYISRDIADADGVTAPGLFWMEQAHLNGHPYAANEMGYCLLIGDCGAPQDYPSAARWFRLGVEQGDTDAAYNLGRMLAYGQGAERDDAEATRLLAIAANDGNDAAAFHVAFRFGEGLDAAPNYRAQRKYLEQAEAAGFGPADYLQTDAFFQAFEGGETVAAILDKADVRPGEMPAALMRIIRAIENSYKPGSDVVTVRFEEDATYTYDAEYAPYMVFALVRMAASLGSTEAQLRMVRYYEEGDLVPRSLVEAHYWRRRAAQ